MSCGVVEPVCGVDEEFSPEEVEFAKGMVEPLLENEKDYEKDYELGRSRLDYYLTSRHDHFQTRILHTQPLIFPSRLVYYTWTAT